MHTILLRRYVGCLETIRLFDCVLSMRTLIHTHKQISNSHWFSVYVYEYFIVGIQSNKQTCECVCDPVCIYIESKRMLCSENVFMPCAVVHCTRRDAVIIKKSCIHTNAFLLACTWQALRLWCASYTHIHTSMKRSLKDRIEVKRRESEREELQWNDAIVLLMKSIFSSSESIFLSSNA